MRYGTPLAAHHETREGPAKPHASSSAVTQVRSLHVPQNTLTTESKSVSVQVLTSKLRPLPTTRCQTPAPETSRPLQVPAATAFWSSVAPNVVPCCGVPSVRFAALGQ